MPREDLVEVTYEIRYRGTKLIKCGVNDDVKEVLESKIWDNPKDYRDEDNKYIKIIDFEKYQEEGEY